MTISVQSILSDHLPDFSNTAKELLEGNFSNEPEALLNYLNVKEYDWEELCEEFDFPKDILKDIKDKDKACEYVQNTMNYFIVYSIDKDVYVVEDER